MRKLDTKKGNLLLYAILLVAAVMLMIALRTCSVKKIDQPGVSEHRHGGDTLNVAMEFSPIGVYASGDTLSGFYYELLQQIAEIHGFPVHVTGVSHGSDVLPRLEAGSIDVVIADMPITAEIKDAFACTRPVLTDRQVLVQLRDSVTGSVPVKSQLDLDGLTVYVPARSNFNSRLENLAREIGGEINVVAHPEYGAEQLVISVALGEIPNAVVNKHVATILARDYPQLDVSVELSFNQLQSWLVNKADTMLRDSLDRWLDSYMTTPGYAHLVNKYF